jgi:hypothetical protein
VTISDDELDRIILKHVSIEKMMEGWKPDFETLRRLAREVVELAERRKK